jgi:RimJ/RimL family protein N-acetyltransferase
VHRLYWHIFCNGKRAGRAFIVVQDAGSPRPDASITIELNAASRGRGIGTVAFRKASELSGYTEVYASIAKGNIASRIAAERAGFTALPESPNRELVMVWRRPKI